MDFDKFVTLWHGVLGPIFICTAVGRERERVCACVRACMRAQDTVWHCLCWFPSHMICHVFSLFPVCTPCGSLEILMVFWVLSGDSQDCFFTFATVSTFPINIVLLAWDIPLHMHQKIQKLSIKQGSAVSFHCSSLVLQPNKRPWPPQLCCTIGAHPLLWSSIPWCPEIVCGWVSKCPECCFLNFIVLDILLIVLAGTCGHVGWVHWQYGYVEKLSYFTDSSNIVLLWNNTFCILCDSPRYILFFAVWPSHRHSVSLPCTLWLCKD